MTNLPKRFKKALCQVKGATVISLIAETKPSLKSGVKIEGLKKIAHVGGLANWVYERAVNNQRVREGLPPDFESERRKWGARLRLADRLLPFVRNPVDPKGGWLTITEGDLESIPPDELYLELKRQNIYRTAFEIDGKPVPTEEIAHLLDKREIEGLKQGVENIVVLRDYKLVNIRELHLKGEVIG